MSVCGACRCGKLEAAAEPCLTHITSTHSIHFCASAKPAEVCCWHEGNCLCLPAALLSCAAAPARAGAKLLWGGQPLTGHTIPECYGAIQPTAVFVPLASMQDPAVFKLVTTEVFGPFQVISEFEGACGGDSAAVARLSRQVAVSAARHV